ncbi:MAG: hypothetical protein E8D42_11765 [Nitrospira sp.]|nr:MAG: hypothetical protein E8D42_11765 [Nitrospira sp.]
MEYAVMEACPLHEACCLAGEHVPIFIKTGTYRANHGLADGGARFIFQKGRSETNDAFEDIFSVTRVDLKTDIGIQDGDKVTIALFYEDGPLFLVFNHRNQQHCGYPEAVNDLRYYLGKDRGMVGRLILGFRLDSQSRELIHGHDFVRILQRIKNL